jgi:hypothetical protein
MAPPSLVLTWMAKGDLSSLGPLFLGPSGPWQNSGLQRLFIGAGRLLMVPWTTNLGQLYSSPQVWKGHGVKN